MGFFIFDEPVSGATYYYGRDRLVRSLLDGVLAGRAFAVCGGPKTGRTSTLMQIEHKLRERFTRTPRAVKHVPIRVDLREMLGQGAVNNAKRLWLVTLRALTDGAVIGEGNVPQVGEPSFQRSKDPWQLYFDGLVALHEQVTGTPAWCRYAYLFDNADVLFHRGMERELSIVSALASQPSVGGPSGVVLAGGRPLRESLFDTSSPLRALRPLLLGVLRESEAAALVRGGLPDLDAQVLNELLAWSGRHPYVLQRLLAELEEHGLAPRVDLAAEAARTDLDTLFEAIWQELDLGRGVTYRGAYAAPEHALLQLLLDHGGDLDVRRAETELSQRGLKEFAEMLEYMGVIERVLRGDTPVMRPSFGLWNTWYAERVSA